MEYGSFMQPEGPMITVFKGWQGPSIRRRLDLESLSGRSGQSCSVRVSDCKDLIETRRATHQEFEFVNSTTPEFNKRADVRMLVRKKARNSYVQRKRQRHTASKLSPPPTPSLSSDSGFQSYSATRDSVFKMSSPKLSNSIEIPNVLGYPTALCISEYAIEMQPRMHRLLSQYLTHTSRRIYPGSQMQSSPLSFTEWFKFAVKDSAALHAMLYSCAVYLALLEGRKESVDSIYHLGQTISIVNQRLRKSTQDVQDSTIGAISCIALGEAITGSQTLWHTHMRGLRQMIRIRSDSYSLSAMLQIKLHRTDISGAIDYSASPYLTFHRSTRPSIWSQLQSLQGTEQAVTSILSACQVHPNLVATIVDLAHFSQAVLSGRRNTWVILDPAALTEDMYWIQYRLLSFPKTSLEGIEERDIDKVCRLGALLYMKALLEEFPQSRIGPSILLNRLQESLGNIELLESTAPLLLWLSLVGASLSKAETRLWFVSQLIRLTIGFRIPSFRDEELAVSKMISLEQVLGSSVSKLWVEVSDSVRLCVKTCGRADLELEGDDRVME